MRVYIAVILVGWLIAWIVTFLLSNFHMMSMLGKLLDYLKTNKYDRFSEVTGSGRHFSFWNRPPFGFYDSIPYVFSSKDNDDESVYKYKIAFKKALMLQLIVITSLVIDTSLLIILLYNRA